MKFYSILRASSTLFDSYFTSPPKKFSKTGSGEALPGDKERMLYHRNDTTSSVHLL